MDIVSPFWARDQERNVVSPIENTQHQNHELESENINNESIEPTSAGPENVEFNKQITPVPNDENVRSKCGSIDMKHGTWNNSRSSRKGKKVYSNLRGRRYLLRSARDGVRVLRSMSKEKSATPSESVSTRVNEGKDRTRKRRIIKKLSNDEFSRNRKRVRYLLTRMGYEQNLIDAYSGEGWKGQSLEKIRPEKELERAKSEITRCKLKIRDLFQHIDASLSEGRLQESLFDHDGEICSEDIFCAKCHSKDLSADNDIILCDGICNRCFHQKCLNPPLLSEEIPSGDEGWLCPACDCKVDCIDMLNEFQESDLSIQDTWEKVFPEAAAIKNGDEQYDLSASDDSEDDDYNPDAPEINTENQGNGSSSDESDFSSTLEDSDSSALNHGKLSDTLGLPSDDSEDVDYNPDGPDPGENVQKESSSSDESDFTSFSDEFMGELNKPSDANDAPTPLSSDLKPLDHSTEEKYTKDRKESSIISELLSLLESDINGDNALSVSGKRQRERLDYKKLYDETYGEASSDSSDDDDDWCNTSTQKKGKKDETGKTSILLPKTSTRIPGDKISSRRSMGKLTEAYTVKNSHLDQQKVSQIVPENTPERTHQKLEPSAANNQVAAEHSGSLEPDCNEMKASASVRRGLGKMVSQKLHEAFKTNKYPLRETKVHLAEELGITLQQVNKWFGNARHSARVAANEASQAALSTPDHKGTDPTRSEDHNKSNKGEGGSSAHDRAKGKDSARAQKLKVASEHMDSGGEMKIVDGTRQNAIKRELRKMRKNKSNTLVDQSKHQKHRFQVNNSKYSKCDLHQ